MTMQVIVGCTQAAEIAARWKAQYLRDGKWENCTAGSERVYNSLLSCGDTAEAIDAIIGNQAWTHLFCEECKEFVDRAVEFGEGYDSKIVCEPCLKAACAMISGVTTFKLKARDIVPGWPRGRSTSCRASGDWQYADFMIQWYRLLGWGEPAKEYAHRLRENREYHERQQAMVDHYRKYFWTPIMGLALNLAVNKYGLVGVRFDPKELV